MTRQFCGFAIALSIVAGLPAATPNYNPGTVTFFNIWTNNGYGSPGPLLEVSPGNFVGLSLFGPSAPSAFLLTSQGAISTIYGFTTGAPGGVILQAVNGRIYGSQESPNAEFSFDLPGNFQTYPLTLPYSFWPSVQLPSGKLYGTEWTYAGDNFFVEMTLDGVTTILHTFTEHEGIPYGAPILGSDGNFYGISAHGTDYQTGNAMVYRITSAGDLTILASYPEESNSAPSTFHATLIEATNGNFYFTAANGGSNHAGAILELSPTGTLTTLYEFTNPNTGAPTILVEGTDGNLYGVAQGIDLTRESYASLFRMTLAGQFETLQAPFGYCPCYLTLGSDGKFYGTSSYENTAFVWDLSLPAPKPRVSGVVPTSGTPGEVVTVNGLFLFGATGVSFNGTPATVFSNITGNYVSVTVPPGATTGPITVTTPNGSSTSKGNFTVE